MLIFQIFEVDFLKICRSSREWLDSFDAIPYLNYRNPIGFTPASNISKRDRTIWMPFNFLSQMRQKQCLLRGWARSWRSPKLQDRSDETRDLANRSATSETAIEATEAEPMQRSDSVTTIFWHSRLQAQRSETPPSSLRQWPGDRAHAWQKRRLPLEAIMICGFKLEPKVEKTFRTLSGPRATMSQCPCPKPLSSCIYQYSSPCSRELCGRDLTWSHAVA